MRVGLRTTARDHYWHQSSSASTGNGERLTTAQFDCGRKVTAVMPGTAVPPPPPPPPPILVPNASSRVLTSARICKPNDVAILNDRQELQLHTKRYELYALQVIGQTARSDDWNGELTTGLEVCRLAVDSHQVGLGQRARQAQSPQGFDAQVYVAAIQ